MVSWRFFFNVLLTEIWKLELLSTMKFSLEIKNYWSYKLLLKNNENKLYYRNLCVAKQFICLGLQWVWNKQSIIYCDIPFWKRNILGEILENSSSLRSRTKQSKNCWLVNYLLRSLSTSLSNSKHAKNWRRRSSSIDDDAFVIIILNWSFVQIWIFLFIMLCLGENKYTSSSISTNSNNRFFPTNGSICMFWH